MNDPDDGNGPGYDVDPGETVTTGGGYDLDNTAADGQPDDEKVDDDTDAAEQQTDPGTDNGDSKHHGPDGGHTGPGSGFDPRRHF